MKKILLAIFGMLVAGDVAYGQQDAQFSQYMFNGIYINPAYAGYREQLNIHSFYRDQWTGIDGAPRTLSVAVDAIANKGNVGLALMVSSDRLGAQSNSSAYANYAYRIKMNGDGSSRLSFGIGAGLTQLSLNGSLLDPNDPERNQPMGTYSTIVPEARAGVFFANDRFYAGFSVDNLLSQYFDQSRFAYIPQPKPHYYLTSGFLIPLSKGILLKPSFLLKEDRGGPTNLDLNLFFILADKVWLGGSYRTAVKIFNKPYLQSNLSPLDAAVAAIQLFPSSNWRLGYAYDFPLGPLKGYGGGAHEISIGYFFNRKKVRMLSPRYF